MRGAPGRRCARSPFARVRLQGVLVYSSGAMGPSRSPFGALVRPRLFAPLLLLLGAAVSAWYADWGLPVHDEGAQLTAAAKILRGGVFYRDIDSYPFPAAPYALAGAMAIFGEHLSVARGLAGALFCASLLSLYAASLRVLRPAGAALFALSLLSLKFLGWPAFSIYIYSDFAFAFACGALALLMHHRFEGPTLRLALAGALIGIAITAKQNLGIYVALAAGAVLLLPRALCGVSAARSRAQEVAVYGLGVALPLAVMAAFFARQGLLGALLQSGLVRPFTGYLPTSAIPFGEAIAWWRLGALRGSQGASYLPLDLWVMLMRRQLPGASLMPLYWLATEVLARLVYTSVPFAFLWAGLRRLRQLRGGEVSGDASGLWILAWLAAAFVASAFPRADWFHVIGVYPPVWLLLLALARPARPSGRRAGVCALATASLLLLSAVLAGLHRSHFDHRLELDRARVDVDPEDAWVGPLVRSISREIPPGDPLFVYGIEAHFYFLSGRFFPWPFSQLYPGQVGPDGGALLARRLAEAAPAFVVRGVASWPGVPDVAAVAPRVAEELRRRYRPDPTFFEDQGGALSRPAPWVVEVWRPLDRSAEPDAPSRPAHP